MSDISTTHYPFFGEGSITWIYYSGGDDVAELTRAIVRSPSELTLEFSSDNTEYTVSLLSIDGTEFLADFPSGRMRASLYQNERGFILFGKWFEKGEEMWVVVRFRLKD